MLGETFHKSSGLLVVRRIDYSTDDSYSGKGSLPNVKMSRAEVVKCYKGIEGMLWPIESGLTENCLNRGLLPINELKSAIEYYHEASLKYYCDLLFIVVGSALIGAESVPAEFSFCGFDYGVYESEFNSFSSIFNEVIYGKEEELIAFAEKLNSSLLLPTAELVYNLHKIRNSLVLKGADLETTDEGDSGFCPIMIFRKNL